MLLLCNNMSDLGILPTYSSQFGNNFNKNLVTTLEKQLTLNTNKNDYWLGPYNIRVPNTINIVTASDGVNILYKNGTITLMECNYHLSKKEYIEKYATLHCEGYYYYNPNKKMSYDNDCKCLLF